MTTIYLHTNGDTTTYFPLPLDVEDYNVAVIELTGKVNSGYNDQVFLCCDICEESLVGSVHLPVLRVINRNNRTGIVNNLLEHLIWLPVVRPSINSIRLYLADKQGKLISVKRNQLNCTLLFTRTRK